MTILSTEWVLRRFAKVGLTQGGVGWRRGESAADYQKRSRVYDQQALNGMKQRRPWILGALALGVVAFVVGLAI